MKKGASTKPVVENGVLKNDNGLKQLSSLIADGESVTDVKERATSTVQSTIAKSNGKSLKQLFLDYYIFIAVPIVIFLLIIVFEIMRRKQKRIRRDHSDTRLSRRRKR